MEKLCLDAQIIKISLVALNKIGYLINTILEIDILYFRFFHRSWFFITCVVHISLKILICFSTCQDVEGFDFICRVLLYTAF